MAIPIQIEVLSHTDPTTVIDVLPGRIDPNYLEELRGPGGGSVSLSRTDSKILANPDLIQARNILRFKVDEKIVGAIVVDDKTDKIVQESAQREQIEVTGESLRTWFNDAVVFPEGGLRKTSYEERAFNFSTAQGAWYNPVQWEAPTDVVQWGDVVDSPWRYAPSNWPDVPDAYWIWSMDSSTTAPAGDNYFRYEFTTATDGKYSFFLAAQDTYSAYVDGQLAMSSQPDAISWAEVQRIDVDLFAGDHVFGVKVTNTEAGPAALIAAVFRAGDAATETPATLISYTGKVGDTNWKVAGYPDPVPGWSPGEILNTLLEEAEARGVRFPLWITPTFTDTEDSYGNEWPRDLDWSFSLGASYASVIEQLEELVCDIWIDPETLELNAVTERGIDRTVYGYDIDEVTINRPILQFVKGHNLGKSSVESSGEIKNAILVQTSEGWTDIEDADVGRASVSTYGRIEAGLSTGFSESVSEAVVEFVFNTKAVPEVGASYEIFPVAGHVPWEDFNVGDWVFAPNELGLLVKRRVMSISVQEDSDTGTPTYEVEFDTIFRDNEDKLTRWMNRMGGSLGSSIANSGGPTPVGPPVVVPPGQAPVLIPVAPTNLAASSVGLWEINGSSPYSQVTLTWDPVTSNTDGSATVPHSYEVWRKLTSESDATYTRVTEVFTNSAVLQPYETGSEWTFKVRALNAPNAIGAFSDPEPHTMLGPTTPMIAPKAPTLSSSLGILQVNWDGEMVDSSNPPPQFRYVYVLVSHNGGAFLRAGSMLQRGGGTVSISGGTVGDTYAAKLVAVDGLGIESAISSASSDHVLLGVDLGDLDAEVQDAIDAAEEAALLARGTINLLSDPSFEAQDEAIWDLLNADATFSSSNPRTGLVSLALAPSATPYNAAKYALYAEVEEGQTYHIGAWMRTASGTVSANAVVIGFEYGPELTSMSSTSEIASTPDNLATTYTYVSGLWVVPSGTHFARPYVRVEDTADTTTYHVDDVMVRLHVTSDFLSDNAVTTDKIAAEAIVASKLAAGSVAAASIQAGAVTTAKLAAGAVTANEISAGTITGNKIAAGTIETVNIAAGVGGELNLAANESITLLVGRADDLDSDLDSTNDNLAEMQTYYQFGPDGAVISKPSSPFQLKLTSEKIQMLELGVEVSYWNAGTMYVRSFVGEEVILSNHKFERYGTGTRVLAL